MSDVCRSMWLYRRVAWASHRDASSALRHYVVKGFTLFRREPTSPPAAAAFGFPYGGWVTFHGGNEWGLSMVE